MIISWNPNSFGFQRWPPNSSTISNDLLGPKRCVIALFLAEVSLSSTAFFQRRKSCAPRSAWRRFAGSGGSTGELERILKQKWQAFYPHKSCLEWGKNLHVWKKTDNLIRYWRLYANAVGKAKSNEKIIFDSLEAYIEDFLESFTWLWSFLVVFF